MTAKPHIVLVPGAWHTGECYDKLIPYLKEAGYSTTALTLPSVGDNPAPVSFDEDVALISSVVKNLIDSGEDVVCVFHSYGGLPGTQAMQGLAKRNNPQSEQPHRSGVIHLVYLCAWLIKEGATLSESRGAGFKPGVQKAQVVDGRSRFLEPLQFFYNDVPREEAEVYAAKLKLQSAGNFDCRLTYGAYKDIPSTYLHCTNDRMIVYEKQKELVANARAVGGKIETVICDASHSPFLSQPAFTADVIRRAAGDQIGC